MGSVPGGPINPVLAPAPARLPSHCLPGAHHSGPKPWLQREVRFANPRTFVWSLQKTLRTFFAQGQPERKPCTGSASSLTSQGSLLVTSRASSNAEGVMPLASWGISARCFPSLDLYFLICKWRMFGKTWTITEVLSNATGYSTDQSRWLTVAPCSLRKERNRV